MRIVVLRLGHRPERDKRMTTHVGLVARAFGAQEMMLTTRDPSVAGSLSDVADRWGGNFLLREEVRWQDELRRFKKEGGRVVHLTMYGTPLPQILEEIREEAELAGGLMIALGAEKVPFQIYQMADWNVAVGSQPHSEVAALAILLDRLQDGSELLPEFQSRFPGKIEVVPSSRGKTVLEHRNSENSETRT